MSEQEAIVEAVLFAAGDTITVDRLQRVLELDKSAVESILDSLAAYYDAKESGIMLVRLENKVQLCTRARYAEHIRRAIETRKPPSLGQASLEVLSIVAYRQPVTRALIEQVRGVDSSGTVSGLVEKGLIVETGRLDVPGRPALFSTTEAFLRTFGVQSLHELPSLPELTGGDAEQLTLFSAQQQEENDPAVQTVLAEVE